MHPFLQVALGAGLGYAVVKLLTKGDETAMLEEELALEGAVANPRRYETRSSRTSRKAASSRCISRKGGKCRWPVGDQYHQRKALTYVQAGRCSETEFPTCADVVNWIAKYGSGEAKQAAKQEKAAMLRSARRARSRRERTRARRSRRSYR